MYLGNIRHNIDVSNEYYMLAKKDEEVGNILMERCEYRHAIYFFIQAMEKYIRAKIFRLVDPKLDYFRKRNQTHSIESAIEFLIDIISPDKNIQQQIKEQLNKYVLQDIKFQQLHNNLRYPYYSSKYNSYSMVDFRSLDCSGIYIKLHDLKDYLQELNRL
ncbi:MULTISPECIES: HEPN domain-containing protein [Clostridium]|uniref:HEPN domain-containing protein n=4 Tax=Clostridium TaxID=1485 RepID=D8GI30_CLOLD|nr:MULTISPECIES: HEPN domain-containing protein [Clostridium]ADK14892.1 conserved hypothetical protein [Clostridium ljungdahlii DSM 13528]OAA87887.1 hypothetical protein WX45_03371 [Clostridium ljungdahlii DSM 13528]OAA94139.1 hypothetical protein WX73_03709 [Clostridium coskatii]OBR96701.1 hypothetical protein CLCOS_08630 [Clostridium coskatii]RMD02391.1 HEPN domain-containing protein [Clostridium autoethanogenum]